MDYMRFSDVAQAIGMPVKLAYTVSEAAQVTGVPVSMLYEEIKDGRLHCLLTTGRKKGMLLRPEQVDRWMDEGER